jgi:hypothetical protein
MLTVLIIAVAWLVAAVAFALLLRRPRSAEGRRDGDDAAAAAERIEPPRIIDFA